MCTLSEDFGFSHEDLEAFKFLEDEAAGAKTSPAWSAEWTRIHTHTSLLQNLPSQDPQRDWLSFEREAQFNPDAWEACVNNQDASQSSSDGSIEDRLTIAICGPALIHRTGKVASHPAALRYISSTRNQFEHLLETMKISPVFLGFVKNSSPVATMHKCTMEGRECTVYFLRVSNSTYSSRQSAISITHFPRTVVGSGERTSGSRTTALIFGYDGKSTSRFQAALRARKKSVFEPRAIVMAFLEEEKEARFLQVRERNATLRTILHKMSLEETGQTRPKNLGRHRDVDDNVGLYLDVSLLKTDALQAWHGQLLSLKAEAEKTDDTRLSSYLARLSLEYEHRISRCDMVLQGASLAYQMETTYLSRHDTSIAIRDGKTMKAIGLLTMIFLPATFTATLMAVPQIQRAMDSRHAFGESDWLWYVFLSAGFTALALVPYLVWSYAPKPGALRRRHLAIAAKLKNFA